MSVIDELHKKIKNKNIANLYLLYGTEEFLIDETLKLLIQETLEPSEQEFNLSIFDMNDVPVDIAMEDAETLPFMGERKIVIVRDPIFLTGQKEKSKITHDLKKLEQYLENPSPDSVVIFVGLYEKLDERRKIVKLLKKNGEVLHAEVMDERSIQKWIVDRVGRSQKLISDSAVQFLMKLVGPNLMLLANEVDKLVLYIGNDSEIGESTVQKLVPRTLEQNIFSLIDMIVKRRTADALTYFYDLLEQKEEPIKILSLLAQQFRLIYQVKELFKRGYGQNQTGTYLKVHPYRVKLASLQAEKFPEEELVGIMNQLAEIDYKMKTGRMDKKLLIELFIIGLNSK
ncbi:DNA polymerase III subunit delta [Bacillus sp. Marseille-P3661]|uniref:DNA polymerase III subunit delta n=1 Tax=Bacillus sp. Marseille-P3661 TaxID=1936234 RepID=UPI0027E5285B|nr:DNA polymerase III subunit delta [Bacillus sp. Marseille-P3661]